MGCSGATAGSVGGGLSDTTAGSRSARSRVTARVRVCGARSATAGFSRRAGGGLSATRGGGGADRTTGGGSGRAAGGAADPLSTRPQGASRSPRSAPSAGTRASFSETAGGSPTGAVCGPATSAVSRAGRNTRRAVPPTASAITTSTGRSQRNLGPCSIGATSGDFAAALRRRSSRSASRTVLTTYRGSVACSRPRRRTTRSG